MRKSVLIDTQLLVLFVVGSAHPSFVERHKRLYPVYKLEQFRRLAAFLAKAPKVICTAHVLAETSNLLGLCGEPMRTAILDAFATLISRLEERHIPALEAARSPWFKKFGLTDVAMLQLPPNEALVLTVDHDLRMLMTGAGFEVWNLSEFLLAES